MQHFQKRPVVVTAVRWNGTNFQEVERFIEEQEGDVTDLLKMPGADMMIWNDREHQWINCPRGHWIIRGIAGEYYPCDPEVFEKTYNPLANISGAGLEGDQP